MVRTITGFIFIVCVVVSCLGVAHADDYHYTNLLVGDRASGMGGAYTAVSDDATGLYYNPAGIVYVTGRNVSASVNAYYDNEKTYKNVIGGNGWSRRSSSLLPNYFGVIQPVGKFKIGLSYAVPDSVLEDQNQTFGPLDLNAQIQTYNPGVRISRYIINFNDENNVYEFGPSIATELTDNLSAGITLYYYQKRELWILHQIIETTNGGDEETDQRFHTSEQGLRPILGFMWSPVKTLSLGLAVSKIMLYNASTDFQYSYHRDNIAVDAIPADSNLISLPGDPGNPSAGNSVKRQYPTEVSFGAAWFPTQSLLLSADVKYFTKNSDQNAEQVTNLALGAEYYISKSVALRGGLYTDNAITPKLDPAGTNQPEHIDLYGATASVSHFTRNTAVTLGGGYTAGTGKAQIVSNGPIQTAESKGWTAFLAASYSY